MKRVLCLLLSIVLLLSLSGCTDIWGNIFSGMVLLSERVSQNSKQIIPLDYVAEDLQIDISQGKVIENRDTHGGWLGDGESIVILSFTPEEYARLEKQLTEFWKPLPLTENLNRCVYGEIGENHVYAPMFTDEEGNPLLPPIEHGHYYFYDRFSESFDPYDDTELISRGTWNFTLAILDSDSYTLHYLLLDT